MAYCCCCVPGCISSSSRTPGKLFFSVPRDEEKRIQWMLAMNRPDISMLSKSSKVCEDHFKLEDDLENYMKFKLQYGKHRLKPDAVPHVFNCFSTHPIKIEPEGHDGDDPKSEPEFIKMEQEEHEVGSQPDSKEIEPEECDDDDSKSVPESIKMEVEEHEVGSEPDPIKVEPEERDNNDPKSEPESIKTELEDHKDDPQPVSDVFVAVKGEPEIHTEETHVLVPEVFIAVKGEPDDQEGDSFSEENFPEVIVSPDDESNGTRKHVHGLSLLCTHCDFQTRCATKLRNHIDVHHPDKSIANGVALWFYCSECGKGPFNAISLKRHVLNVHEKERRESEKERIEMEKKRIEREKKIIEMEKKRIEMEKKESVHPCSECEYVGGTKRQLKEHFYSRHSEVKPFSCSQCDYKTGRKAGLRKHVLRLHTYLSVHRCPECDFSTKYYKSLEIHIVRRHTEASKYGCPECEFSANLKKTLQKHVLEVHVGKRSFPCSLCPYKAKNEKNLKEHFKITHPRLYECSKCGFSATKRDALREHVASHPKEKPSLPCPYCDFLAPSNHQLRLHKKDKHPEIKEPTKKQPRVYQCSYKPCSYRSLSRMSVDMHETLKHSREYPYYCHSCGRGMCSFSALQGHFTSQHKNEAIPEWLRAPSDKRRTGRRPKKT